MKRAVALVMLLGACATSEDGPPALRAAPAPPPVYRLQDLSIPPTPVPPAPTERPRPAPSAGQLLTGVARANRDGLDLPVPDCFAGKTCTYWYHPDRHYLVYMAELDQTLVCLEPGEVALDVSVPGGQVLIPHTVLGYGTGARRTECLAFVPRQAGLNQQISIFTDRRKYDLNVRTFTHTHHVEVRWRYPEQVLAALNGRAAAAGDGPALAGAGLRAPRDRSCAYALSGDDPPWRPAPTRDGQPPVCDDGEITFVQFPPGVIGAEGAPGVWRVDGTGGRSPVQFGRIADSYRIAGLHDHLVLSLDGREVTIRRSPHWSPHRSPR